jgi:hypothetical protein
MKRITTKVAADRLGVSSEMVRQYHAEGWLVGRTTSGVTGRGRRLFFDPGEVEAFARGGAAGAAAYRKRARKAGAAR